MKYSVLEDMLERINETSSGIYYYLCSRDGEIIYHPRWTEINRGLFKEKNNKAASYEDGIYEMKTDGQKENIVVGSVAYTGWKLIGVVPESVQETSINKFRYYIITTILILVMMLLQVNRFISRKISRPIRELDESVKAYEAGAMPDIYIGGSAEIRHLGYSVQKSYEQIEALMKEHEETLKNIARYEDILNNYDSMAEVIIEDLEHFKKEYARKRRTVVENGQEAVYEEKKVEEQEVVFLMDRFGYAKTVDVATYERNKEAADAENKWIVNCINTGKLCVFTNTGKMHQIKVLDLPYGKFRDKGQPIDNVSNYDSTQEMVVYMCDELQLRYAKLLFATKQGMIKKVKGNEFQVAKRTIAATKLQEDDELISVQVITDDQHVVLQTKDGYFLRFSAQEIAEKKKAAVGVRGIKLRKNDELEQIYLFYEGTEHKISYGDRELTLNRLKVAKRDGTGTKARS